jgi:hypothetical protein
MTEAAAQHFQSDDAILRASVDDQGGCCWELCAAAGCLRDRSRLELMRRWNQRPASCQTDT